MVRWDGGVGEEGPREEVREEASGPPLQSLALKRGCPDTFQTVILRNDYMAILSFLRCVYIYFSSILVMLSLKGL